MNQELMPVSLANLVSLEDGKPVTTSRIVAEVFGKRHDHVLRDIDNIIDSSVYQSRREPNFGETSVLVPLPNGGTREDRAFKMDHKGFEVLAMGFTGRDALRWKFDFADAFEKLAAEAAGLRRAWHPAKSDLLDIHNDVAGLRNEIAELKSLLLPRIRGPYKPRIAKEEPKSSKDYGEIIKTYMRDKDLVLARDLRKDCAPELSAAAVGRLASYTGYRAFDKRVGEQVLRAYRGDAHDFVLPSL